MTGRPAPETTTADTTRAPARSAKNTAGAQMKGRPSMSQTTAPEITQARVIEVLARLTAEDAPSTQWTLYDDDAANTDCLDGHLFGDTDTDRRQGLAAWQRIIDAGPVDVRPNGGKEHLRVHGSYEGVKVTIVTVVTAASDSCCSHCQAAGGAR